MRFLESIVEAFPEAADITIVIALVLLAAAVVVGACVVVTSCEH